jgi:hypothetical protein
VPSAITARVPPRVAAFCGLLTPLTSTVGWLVGGYVQRNEYSSLDDDISDLGALTASHPWIYNQIGAPSSCSGRPRAAPRLNASRTPAQSLGVLREVRSARSENARAPIRTETGRVLKPVPLPVGLRGPCPPPDSNRDSTAPQAAASTYWARWAGARPEIRTQTVTRLKRVPLPVGLDGLR